LAEAAGCDGFTMLAKGSSEPKPLCAELPPPRFENRLYELMFGTPAAAKGSAELPLAGFGGAAKPDAAFAGAARKLDAGFAAKGSAVAAAAFGAELKDYPNGTFDLPPASSRKSRSVHFASSAPPPKGSAVEEEARLCSETAGASGSVANFVHSIY